jgi:hypothetical protein
MTVAELIKELQALPQDIQIMMLDSERESPVEIVQVSRGTWQAHGETEDIDWGVSEPMIDEEPEFIQDDENGDIAVLVTW